MLIAYRVCLLGAVICVLSLMGCGGEEAANTANSDAGSDKSSKTASNSENRKRAAADQQLTVGDENFGDGPPSQQEPAPADSATPPGEPEASPSEADSEQNPVPLPELFTDWTDEHFETAVRWRSLRLPEAILIRAESSTEQPTIFFTLLRQLLEVSLEPPVDPPNFTAAVTAAAANSKTSTPQISGSLGARRRDDEDEDEDEDDSLFVEVPDATGKRVRVKMPPGWMDLPEVDDGAYWVRGHGKEIEFYLDGDDWNYYSWEQQGNSNGSGSAAPDVGATGKNQLSERQLVQAIVQGLLMTDSTDAWDTLQSVLLDQQETKLELEEASIVVFEEVFGSESVNAAMAEALAVAVLNTTDQTLPAMELLVSLASRVARVDLHLTDAAADAAADGPSGDLPGSFGGGDEDFGGGDEDFGGGDEDFGGGDEDFGGLQGANAFRGETKADPDKPIVKLPELQLPPDSIQSVLPVFRSPALITAVQKRLADVTDLNSGKSVVALASMLPDQKLRHTTYQLFQKCQLDGAEMLRELGYYGLIARDPGHLVVLKSLKRLKKPAQLRFQESRRTDRARISWEHAKWETVFALRNYLKKSSKDTDIAWEGALKPRPYKEAILEDSTAMVIEDVLEGTEGVAGGTRVYYTRSRVTARDTREKNAIKKYYEKQASGISREKPGEGVLWIDGVRGKSDGTRTTLDVIISQSGSFYTVETIAVVAADPRKSAEPEETAESK